MYVPEVANWVDGIPYSADGVVCEWVEVIEELPEKKSESVVENAESAKPVEPTVSEIPVGTADSGASDIDSVSSVDANPQSVEPPVSEAETPVFELYPSLQNRPVVNELAPVTAVPSAESKALQPIIDWLGDVFVTEHVETVTYSGYHSEWVRSNRNDAYYELKELPFDVTISRPALSYNIPAFCAFFMAVLVLVTFLTAIKNVFWR